MSKDTGGSAFPINGEYDEVRGKSSYVSAGMTLRDYFAAKAMSGRAGLKMSRKDMQNMAVRAYDLADAMLEARK